MIVQYFISLAKTYEIGFLKRDNAYIVCARGILTGPFFAAPIVTTDMPSTIWGLPTVQPCSELKICSTACTFSQVVILSEELKLIKEGSGKGRGARGVSNKKGFENLVTNILGNSSDIYRIHW